MHTPSFCFNILELRPIELRRNFPCRKAGSGGEMNNRQPCTSAREYRVFPPTSQIRNHLGLEKSELRFPECLHMEQWLKVQKT